MCRNRRDRRRATGQVYFTTARVIKGLPFVCRLSIEKVLTGILARAQTLYPVEICAFVFMGNHYHLIITGHSKHISPFMNYIQGNIAQSVQRLIPNYYEKSVWDGRFKEQVLVTAEDVIAKMEYIYLNPVRARLTRKAKEYPGVHSYNHLRNDKESFLVKWIPVSKLCGLPERYRKKEDFEITKKLLKKGSYAELKIKPFAWFSSFHDELDKESIRERLLNYVAQEENNYKTVAVVGVEALRNQSLRKPHKPKSKTPTPYIICHDKELRLSEIDSYRSFCALCKKAWLLIKKGIKAAWPKGAYMPAFYRGWALSG